MTSQYFDNTKTALQSPTPTAMRINPSSPYQNITQQQSTPAPLPSQLHQPVNKPFQHLSGPIPSQTGNAIPDNSHFQGTFSSQQQNLWSSQQLGYIPTNKMMPSTSHPATAAPPNNNIPNVNVYQQNVTPQQWPQNPQQNYDNFYQQLPQGQQMNNNIYEQQQQTQKLQQPPQQLVSDHIATTYYQQQQAHTSQNNTNSVNFFEQSNSNQQAGSADGWSDWDWHENSTLSPPHLQDAEHLKSETNSYTNPQPQSLNQQQADRNCSILADSFDTQNNNDTWNWGSNENDQQVSNEGPKKLENHIQNNNSNCSKQANEIELIPGHVMSSNKQHDDNWSWNNINANPQDVTAPQNLVDIKNQTTPTSNHIPDCSSPPPPPPPTEFSSLPPENHNYNTNSTASPPNNIPNTVFVTQAKPVTLPSRQYASPPNGNTPIVENTTETALVPPQGFENIEEPYQKSAAAGSTSLPPPVIPKGPALPPLASLQTGNSRTNNPFKRTGVAQHHRATGLGAKHSGPGQPPEPTVFNMPPPPPADFANPGTITLMEPDNNELPSQENQEVILNATTEISLPNATLQSSGAISLPINVVTHVAPPPNDERNQYLQTSHLSENSEDQQPEIDGLLPPPGLSRLVLGEPELEASAQRMVMGTEASNTDSTVTQAAVMHLEERHADGEDTASENAIPIASSIGQGVAASSSGLSSDRNLYMVPGESNTTNNNQQQRVVTGVELGEQREIEMDGENLEDEQIQQLQLQHQHQNQALSAEARNEPPVEGADDTAATTSTITSINTIHANELHTDQPHHSSNQLAKIKDSNPISSPNDDDSDERLLNDRGLNQSVAGSTKSRTKYEHERLVASSRRRDKRSSGERYESDEYLNSEGEYSSEREERQRRERDRRHNYREGSVRSDHGVNVEDDKRSRRHRAVASKRDKYYYEGEERSRGGRDERERDRGVERSKLERRSQRQRGYEADSRYETEESTRMENRKDPLRRSTRRSDHTDTGAEYDDYSRRGAYRSSKRAGDNYESDRRDRRRSEKHREGRYREEPRYDPREYEEYRKHSSRNARESDMEKDAAVPLRTGRMHHDPRHVATASMYGYPSGGYYDPYTAYYYQQMARTNPQAYAEWYKKYYGQTAAGVSQNSSLQIANSAGQADTSLPASGNAGRESVHSGRSSAHNDVKDRYTHAYITQANDYHRHYQQQQHLHLQHFHQQQQQMAFNQTLNSTMLDEENLNHNTSMYSGFGSLSLARSNTNLSQIHGGYYMPATGTTAAGVYYARSDYAESRSGALSARDPDPSVQEPQRLTPCKFITEHAVVDFASGILVTVKPKYTPSGNISNIVKFLKFKPNDETRKLFSVFPGPLVRGLTHKKTVIEFCQEQIRLGPIDTTIYAKQLITNNADKYRGSYTLMWNLLILLLKQNGMVVGTDIAELLLKNQQEFPFKTPNSSANNSLESKSGSNSPIDDFDLAKDSEQLLELQKKPANPEQEYSSEVNEKPQDEDDREDSSLAKSSSNSTSLTEDEVTEKFRNYLLYGNVNEALEWAADNNLWGHALFLASKLHRRAHANVMMKFANKLSLNDPLQTLYQLMSGRTPSSVTCVQDERWGDWRPHLSMILSNTSQKPELDRKSITTLGDSLFHRGDLYAAHFCYVMAQVGFGRYQQSATQETSLQQHLPKLILLGSSHYKHFNDFAHNESIIMTEIYEYACSLNDDKFSIVEFQPYKFLLATRLLDYGFHLKSLMYLEQTAAHISRDPLKYENSFINKVYELGERLKYYDPVMEKTIDDQHLASDDNELNATQPLIEEQSWLQNLRELTQNNASNFNATVPTAVSQNLQPTQLYEPPNYNQQQQQIDQQFMEINKQFSELNLQYQQQTTDNTEQQYQQQPMFYNSTQQQQQNSSDLHLSQQQQQQSQQSLQTELPNQSAKDLQQPAAVESQLQDDYQPQQQPQYLQPEIAPHSAVYTSNYYDPSQYNAADTVGNRVEMQSTTNYDYWPQQQQDSATPLINENARPTISLPKSRTYDTDDEITGQALQQQHTNNDNNKRHPGVQQQQPQQKGSKKEDAVKNQQQSNQNSGWFGGIWNKFSLKPKNQMILPDDKNPSIVWDPEKKKWVNTDGDEDEQESLKPPPKMSDLIMPQQSMQQDPQMHHANQMPFLDHQQMQQPQQQQSQQLVSNTISHSAPSPNPPQQQQNPNHAQPQFPAPTPTPTLTAAPAPAAAKTPNLQSNMFKMQRNRTLKNAYVDVFNPSGAPVNKAAENILAPALPPATVPQSGFLIPGSVASSATGSSQEQQYQQQHHQQQQAPQQDSLQFYNPNQFSGGTGY